MPTLAENTNKWDGTYHWNTGGDNWSRPWGSVAMQWHASLWPRIRSFLPAGKILEIAPGFGRWTEFLLDHCESLVAVDLSKRCVEACQQRFGHDPRFSCFANDGTSLDMVADGSIDFAFSFDSLVHAEAEVVQAYIEQLGRKLTPEGVAFLHHSNLGAVGNKIRLARATGPLRPLLRAIGIETKDHGRAWSMTAEKLRHYSAAVGLHVVGQELINWLSPLPVDCLSIIAGRNSRWAGQPTVEVCNLRFMAEAKCIATIAPLYDHVESLAHPAARRSAAA